MTKFDCGSLSTYKTKYTHSYCNKAIITKCKKTKTKAATVLLINKQTVVHTVK